jgi:hypothetical protein
MIVDLLTDATVVDVAIRFDQKNQKRNWYWLLAHIMENLTNQIMVRKEKGNNRNTVFKKVNSNKK